MGDETINLSGKAKLVEIDDYVKTLLRKAVKKAGTHNKLAEILGYSTPSNIIYQFLSAPKYKKNILASRLKRLKQFLGES